ncbi:response regulator [Solemya velesiana gill symbiont]|uniref:DNA-binding response regulator n=1 Tax=Solemya velesiana gill symbiont TaxID=1918948 RepID=A0A1T2KSE6_9GAMM|nr:response regulator [Solemya velesiana gill symbiont]OOZ35785.1 DNA-binding response regulator [Solemya velesiana gill symbiont]
MERQQHLLVVDDDREIRELLQAYLEQNGYRVSTVGDGKGMWSALEASRVDLIVLDLMLPGTDGLELCRTLRVKSQVPVIMLTARGDEMDRILGLEMGADDYLPKPFNPRELLARIKVVLRRFNSVAPREEEEETGSSLFFAGWKLDTVGRHLEKAGVVSALSGAEYRLLKVFLDHPNRILTRDQLLDLTQGREADPFDRSIDVLVSRLRKRLDDGPKEPTIIKTVRGEGYVLSARVSKQEPSE